MAVIFNSLMDLDELYNRWKEVEQKCDNLFALLLYNKDYLDLRKYILESYELLDDLTGPDVYVFIIDDLKAKDPPTKIFGLLRELGISYKKIPCLAFFQSLEDNELYIYKIEKEKPYSEQFQYIFEEARRCCIKYKELGKKI